MLLCNPCPISRKSILSTQTKILELNSSQIHSGLQNPISLFWKSLPHRFQVWTTRNHRTTRRCLHLSLLREIQLEPKALTGASSQKGWPWHLHHLMSKAVWTSEQRGNHQLTSTPSSYRGRQTISEVQTPPGPCQRILRKKGFIMWGTLGHHRGIYSRADMCILFVGTQPPPWLRTSVLDSSVYSTQAQWLYSPWYQGSPLNLPITHGKPVRALRHHSAGV